MPEITLERRLLERTAPRPGCLPNLLTRQVLAQRQLRRRRSAGGEHSGAAVARGVDGGEEVLLAARVERLHVVKHDQIRRSALRRAQQMAAAAARLAPEVHDRFAKAALGK